LAEVEERRGEEIVRLWEIGVYAERVGFVFLEKGWGWGKVLGSWEAKY
jgi:hypothetical protein